MIVLYIFLAILAFGLLIFFHELGHFAFAKIFKVAINEFSIGMGPKIISKRGKDGVAYSLRLFPIGGFVSMAGEDEESDDPNAYDKKPAYQRFIIVVAGAVMNIIIAVILVFIVTLSTPKFATTQIHSFFVEDSYVQEYNGLLAGDKIVEIDGKKISYPEDINYQILLNGSSPLDFVVERDGKRVTVYDVKFAPDEQDGFVYGTPNIVFLAEKRTFNSVIKNTFHSSVSTVKMIWDSIAGLLTGKFGVQQLSGPIGVTGAMVEVAKVDIRSFVYLVAVISMNLGVFNLMPIPALDGGTLLLTLIEMITKKKLPKKVEDIIKLVGFALLMSLVVFVSIKDVFKLLF